MEYIVPLVIIAALIYLGRIKIPKGLKPVPALELEFPLNYEASISINNDVLVTLPVDDRIIDECKSSKGSLSKSAKYLKYKKEGNSEFELLINLRDTLQLSEDTFKIDITYKKIGAAKIVQKFGEIDYSIAYIHDGKLLLNSDIQEKNFKLEDEGQITLTFDNLAQKVQKRIDRFS